MNLLDIYKKSFQKVVLNPVITLLLITFIIISNLIASYAYLAKSFVTTSIITFCTLTLSLCFIAGWFHVIKDISKNDENENKNYFGIFAEGIGKDIISILIASLIYGIFLIIVLILTGKIAHHLFGSLDFIIKDMMTITQDNNAFIEYLSKLSDEQKYILSAWELSIIFSMMFYNFLMLFYFPAIINDEKSNMFLKPFIAIKNSICFLFKNFFGALAIHISIYVFYMLIAIFNAAFASNFIISILLIFINIYFISTSIMLIFNYYEQKNCCNNRPDSIRENENINQSGEEN